MKRRYILAPQAARDLVQIWRYIKNESSQETADRVESVIRGKFVYLADFPQGGHWRRDLTAAEVRFLASKAAARWWMSGPVRVTCASNNSRRLEQVGVPRLQVQQESFQR
jgi:plasmid stabilization system protein ParE